ncbi:hypothetical protein BASA82_000465 [Batrachochytrium salamandrivorans]|nr:hypothetical protein BASA82_000465 [Batrachochytrium salamandrivorans]
MMGWFLTLLSFRLAMLWTLNPRVSFGGSAPVSWLSTKSMTLISAYDCLGQAVQYGKELLRLCPARQQAVTILFNLRTVRIVVVSRRASSSSLHVEASNTVAMDTSGPSFIWSAAVTAHSSSTLPWSLAKALVAPLPACSTPAKYCAKIFKPTRDSRFDEFRNEKAFLKATRLARLIGGRRWTKKNTPGTALCSRGGGKKEGGIPEDKQQEQYAGSIWFAADSVLTGLLANWELKEDTGDLVSASTDLESMVKTIASMTVPGACTFLTRCRAKLQGKPLTPEMIWKVWPHPSTNGAHIL